MVGKRVATTDLNHDNWDQEDEPEQRGTFRTATQEELKSRVIKKARRKIGAAAGDAGEEGASGGSNDVSGNKSVFSGFSGFGKPASSTAAASPFAFLSKLPSTSGSTTEGAAKPNFSFQPSSTSNATSAAPGAGFFSLAAKKDSTSTTDGGTTATPSIFGGANAPKKVAGVGDVEKPASVFKSSVPDEKSESVSSSNSEDGIYREKVAQLNRSVVDFLKKHVDDNPYCLLTPVFESYSHHLKGFKQPLPAPPKPAVAAAPASVPAAATPSTAAPATTFSFGKPAAPASSPTTAAPGSLMFGKKPNCTVTSGSATTTATPLLFSFGNTQSLPGNAATSFSPGSGINRTGSIFGSPAAENKPLEMPKPGFFSFGNKDAASKPADSSGPSPPKTNGFGLKNDDKPSTSGFSFAKSPSDSKLPASSGFSFMSSTTGSAAATPFSFGNLKPPAPAATSSAAAEAEDEEDTPPKVEFKQVVEDDAIYSKRCKVFVKKANDFAERGVGTLYLKPVKDSSKTQMLVRADTNLGNILINLMLSEGLPCKRMGKNNVMMVGMPTPDEGKAFPILLRVKSGEEADELLEQIQKHLK